MSTLRPIEIVGGGLAGLSLGLGLRRAGVPVTILEAGHYPRHRVCGEFITGLAAATVERLGLTACLRDARLAREVAWFSDGKLLRCDALPEPALALSRHALDERLATAFVAAGGNLKTDTRAPTEPCAGRVIATGRRRAQPRWIGLKAHARGLPLAADLEVHLGRQAYVGMSEVENGAVNICGLFRVRAGLGLERGNALMGYLQAAGLTALAGRLVEAAIEPVSRCAVAGFGFGRAASASGGMALGDAFAMIPPFTGHGMAMAFQGAEQSLDPLLAWARGAAEWPATVAETQRRLGRTFSRRLRSARMLHSFLLSPGRQRLLAAASRFRLLPVHTLYAVLHG